MVQDLLTLNLNSSHEVREKSFLFYYLSYELMTRDRYIVYNLIWNNRLEELFRDGSLEVKEIKRDDQCLKST